MSSWLQRYRDGDRVQVWTEMTSAGAELSEPASWQDAVEVARLTMSRVRLNVEHLLELLPRAGHVFRSEPGLPVFEPPPVDVGDQLDQLQARVGPIPLALRCWYEQVGRVNLIGAHPEWGYDYPDPLVVDAPVDFVLSEYDAWQDDRGTEWDRGRFTIDLAPDYLHKADVSGGAPYGMAVPDAGVDGLLLGERHQTTFVNYLRISLRWAGMPGWDRGALDGWARPEAPAPAVLGEIAEALLPI